MALLSRHRILRALTCQFYIVLILTHWLWNLFNPVTVLGDKGNRKETSNVCDCFTIEKASPDIACWLQTCGLSTNQLRIISTMHLTVDLHDLVLILHVWQTSCQDLDYQIHFSWFRFKWEPDFRQAFKRWKLWEVLLHSSTQYLPITFPEGGEKISLEKITLKSDMPKMHTAIHCNLYWAIHIGSHTALW